MAGSIGLAEYIQADFHQIVTTILFTIALQIRFLSRHQIGLLDSIYFIGINPASSRSSQAPCSVGASRMQRERHAVCPYLHS